ncbi:helix-turn-helix domain-containing protein [Carnobacterium maltaromaticum]|uniref:helix-turn-helix domain-containing protein n=1 Tax=Carnobacterium maltaromaticum TaxID=2751 RepID=UPI0039BDEDF6
MIINSKELLLARAKLMLTINDLSKKADVGKSTISKLENGKSFGSPIVIAKLANALEVDITSISKNEVK